MMSVKVASYLPDSLFAVTGGDAISMKKGQRVAVTMPPVTIKNPTTGEELGVYRPRAIIGIVRTVHERFAICAIAPGDDGITLSVGMTLEVID